MEGASVRAQGALFAGVTHRVCLTNPQKGGLTYEEMTASRDSLRRSLVGNPEIEKLDFHKNLRLSCGGIFTSENKGGEGVRPNSETHHPIPMVSVTSKIRETHGGIPPPLRLNISCET